ncbi:MAG: phosphoenolpyruvate synthase, partial [Thiovulaceae bacterium]|nr:phosphoenolpyruvate synthase [Sulfurimonadaceae bacterium]
MNYIRFFNQLSINDIPQVGGKNASLGEMYNQLSQKGINIPNGFATTSNAYWLLLQQDNLKEKIHDTLKDLDATDTSQLQEKAKRVRELILNTEL